MSTILIAEDQARITSFIEKGLHAHGFSTEVVTDGEQALRRALSEPFALLVLDLGLPGKDGIEVLRELRRKGSSLPVVVVTARHGLHDGVLGLEADRDDYLTKPFRFDELLARIQVKLSDALDDR